MIKNNKGITLIALAVIVVILMILAGITINQITDDNGILRKAFQVKSGYEDAEKNELDEFNRIKNEAEKE